MRLFAALILALVLNGAQAQDYPTETAQSNTPRANDASVPLRDYLISQDEALARRITDLDRLLMQRMNLNDERVDAIFQATKEAAQKAEDAQALRNIVANEFRATLDDQAKTFASREWAESQVRNLSDRLDQMASRLAAIDVRLGENLGKGTGVQTAWAALGGAVAIGGILFGAVMALRRSRTGG